MKHILLLIMTAMLLTACTGNEEPKQASAEQTVKSEEPNTTNVESETATKPEEPDTFIESPQAPDDRNLTEVGDTYSDLDGKLELHAFQSEEQTINVGPMKVTIHGAKFMNYRPSPDMIDYFHGYTKKETTFNYLKLRLTIENTSDEPVNFAAVSHLETNTGEQKSFEDDFYIENLHGDFAPGEVKKGQMGFVLDETSPEELTSITVVTSDVFKEKESVEEAASYTIEF